MKRKGVIYILTNPASPQYVQVGYVDVASNEVQDPVCDKLK